MIPEKELENYRAKNFKIEVEPCKHGQLGEITVKITKNGYQWQTIDLTPSEQLKLIQTLILGFSKQ